MKLNLGRDSEARFGQDFRSVVPLAMFLKTVTYRQSQGWGEAVKKTPCNSQPLH